MRQLFSVLFLAVFSFSFSQCEIGKISFALGDVLTFFINGKVEGENKNERKENKDADVNYNLKENIFITTPMHKKNSSSMSGSSLYSEIYTTAEISTTASQTSQNNVCHNVDGKGVFDCAGNSFFAKRDLISSFKSEQEAGDDSDDKKELLIHNNKEQPKREDSRYLKLIRKKIKEQENQAGTLYLVRVEKGSSIFVPRYAFIGNNKISQEVADKKDAHKYLHILKEKNRRSIQLERKDKRNNAKNLRKYKPIEGGSRFTSISSSQYSTSISEKELNINNKHISIK